MRQIAQKDLLHTDLYLFEVDAAGNLLDPRGGAPLIERRGANWQELHGLKPTEGRPGSLTLDPGEDDYFAKMHLRAWARHPGEKRYRLYVVNRVTGYIGSVRMGLVHGAETCFGDGNSSGGDARLLVTDAPEAGNGLGTPSLVPYCSETQSFGGVDGSGEVDSSAYIPLHPPNIKVEAFRRRAGKADEKLDAAEEIDQDGAGMKKVQRIGFEGAGLTSDEFIVIRTSWLDQDGEPLPQSLPGFSGRLAYSTGTEEEGNSELAPVDAKIVIDSEQSNVKSAVFNIKPGENEIQVVLLPKDQLAQHYYLHVGAVPKDRCDRPKDGNGTDQEFLGRSSVCVDFGAQGDEPFEGEQLGALSHRPANYVPIKVPLYDEQATRDALRLQADTLREEYQAAAAAGGDELPDVPKIQGVKPIYRYVYRPEFQFSLYDLSFEGVEEVQTITEWSDTTERSQTVLDFAAKLTAPESDALTGWGQKQTLLWAVGFSEILAVADGSAQLACPPEAAPESCAFSELENAAALQPSAQLGVVDKIIEQLGPEDLLALQLYAAGDAGNVLYEYDLGYPLVQGEAQPITLARARDASALGKDRLTDTYALLRFRTHAASTLTPKLYQSNEPAPGEEPVWTEVNQKSIWGGHLPAGDHVYALSYELVKNALLPLDKQQQDSPGSNPNFRLDFEFTKLELPGEEDADAVAQEPPASHIIRYPGTLILQMTGSSVGSVIVHDVNITEGAVALSRTDFSIPGAGPGLEFSRSYSNLAQPSSGDLGQGWTHSLGHLLVPLGTEGVGQAVASALPDWVKPFTQKPGLWKNIESHIVEENRRRYRKVYVNGTTFSRADDESDWVADEGRFAKLKLENQPCSELYSSLSAADDPEVEETEPPELPPGCFVFTSVDGTEYVYDEPRPKRMYPLKKDEPFSLGVGTRLVYRAGMTDLALQSGEDLEREKAHDPYPPTKVRLVRDRFGQRLGFYYLPGKRKGTQGALIEVRDFGEGEAFRSCILDYRITPSSCGSVGLSGYKDRLRQIRCLGGEPSPSSEGKAGETDEFSPFSVDFCYNESGLLSYVRRGDIFESYEYDLQQDDDGMSDCGENSDPTPDPEDADEATDPEEEPPLPELVIVGEGADGTPPQPVGYFADEEAPPEEEGGDDEKNGEGLSHCPHNLVRIVDERGDATEFTYFAQQSLDLGLEALRYRSSADVVRSVTPLPTVNAKGDKVLASKLELSYQGLARTVPHVEPLFAANTRYTLDSAGRVAETVIPQTSSGGGILDSRRITQTWVAGLLDSETVSDSRTTRTANYAYDPETGDLLQQSVVATAEGKSVNVEIDTTWTAKFSLPSTRTETRQGTVVSDESWGYDGSPAGSPTVTLGFLSSRVDAAGHTWTYTPSSDFPSLVGSETSPEPNDESAQVVTGFGYDAHGNRESATTGVNTIVTEHNVRGDLVLEKDAARNERRYVYDDNSRLLSTVLPPSTTTPGHVNPARTYENRWLKTSTDRNGLVTTYEHSPRGEVVSVTLSEGGTRRFGYDLAGNLVEETDFLGKSSTYTHDSLGHLLTSKNREDDVTTHMEVDTNGNVWRMKDADDIETVFVFDGMGRQVSRERQSEGDLGDPSAPFLTVYDAQPLGEEPAVTAVRTTDEVGRETVMDLDGLGRPVQITSGEVVTATRYDARGNVILVQDPEGACLLSRYDANGYLAATLATAREASAQPGSCPDSGYLVVSNYDAELKVNVIQTWPEGEADDSLSATAGQGRVAESRLLYDAWDRLAEESLPTVADSEANGDPIQYFYNGEGATTQVVDARRISRQWAYNKRGWLLAYKDGATQSEGCSAEGTSLTATICYGDFDANGNPQKITDARGGSQSIRYDDEERAEEIIEGSGPEQRTTTVNDFNGFGQPTNITEAQTTSERSPTSITRELVYNGSHQLFTEKLMGESGRGVSTPDIIRTFTYRADGLLESESTSDGDDTFTRTYKYDDNNHLEFVYYPDENTLERSELHDRAGTLLSATNAAGGVQSYELDDFGRVENVLLAGKLVSTTDYRGDGNVVATVDGRDNRTTYEYDLRGRLIETTYPAGSGYASSSEKRKYDEVGNLRRFEAPSRSGEPAYSTIYTYDGENRPLSMAYSQNGTSGIQTTRWEYDELGNVEVERTPKYEGGGPHTQKSYDSLGRLDEVIDAMGVKTSFTYDGRDNLLSQTVAGGTGAPAVTIEYGYNSHNQLESSAEQGATTLYSDLDLFGNPGQLHAPNGSKILYKYDEYGRRTSADYPVVVGGAHPISRMSWDYDDEAASLEVRETRAGATDVTVITSDPAWGRVASETRRDGGTVTYSYDDSGNLELIALSSSAPSSDTQTGYTYDSLNRVEEIRAGPDALTTLTYYPDGRVDTITYPNDNTQTRTYHPDRRVKNITTLGPDGAVQLAYEYDLNGNRTRQVDTRPDEAPYVTTYGYDALDRLENYTLAAETPLAEKHTYTYVGHNRRTEELQQMEAPGNGLPLQFETKSLKTWNYDERNRLKLVEEGVPGAEYTLELDYDANGNLIERVRNAGDAVELTLFDFDARDNMVSAIVDGRTVGRFDYDHQGYRVRAEDTDRGSVDSFYAGSALHEQQQNGSAYAVYHPLGGSAVALENVGAGTGVSYYHNDAIGSVSHLTEPDGTMGASYRTDPWGAPIDPTAFEGPNRKLFTGHEYDPETRLHHMKARYMDPEIGRFTSADSYMGEPGNPLTLHRYGYAGGNPSRFTDPTGHFYVDEDANNVDPSKSPGFDPENKEHVAMGESHTPWICRSDANGGRQCLNYDKYSNGLQKFTTEDDSGTLSAKRSTHPEALIPVINVERSKRRTTLRTIQQQEEREEYARSPQLREQVRRYRQARDNGTLDFAINTAQDTVGSAALIIRVARGNYFGDSQVEQLQAAINRRLESYRPESEDTFFLDVQRRQALSSAEGFHLAYSAATGIFATGVLAHLQGRVGRGGAGLADDFAYAPRGGANLSDELLRSGDQARRRLRKELGLGRGDADEAHHLIPLSVRDHDIVKAAATEGFDFNGAMNGMPLSFDRHRGVNIFHHNKYNAAIRKRLDYEQALNPNMTPKQAAELLEAYTSKLRAGISRSKGRLK